MRSPYDNRPARSFWRTGVVEAPVGPDADLYRPEVKIDRSTRIATAGSCFAQHIGRALRERGFTVLDAEPAPGALDRETASRFGYGLYSARYGNIYTVRQFVQLVEEAYARFAPAEAVWEKDGRCYDALRPAVEPDGLRTAELVAIHRARHLAAVRGLLEEAEVLVFTLGLTEAWVHRASGTVYPTAPGTIAGSFDPDKFAFVNFGFDEVRGDFVSLHAALKAINPRLKIIVTVSPVPLTATATDDHVLVASAYAKAVLRAVAGTMAATLADVDYFPSYEIVTGAPSRGRFFGENLRTVTPEGVATVMATFFAAQDAGGAATSPAPAPTAAAPSTDDETVCEDAMLEAFSR